MNTQLTCLLLDIGGSNIKTYDGATAANKINDILTNVGMAVGGVLVAVAVFKLIMALGDESTTSKANASVLLGSGIFFLSLSTIVNLIGLSSGMSINSSTPRLIAGNVVTVLGNMMTYAGGAMIVLGVFQYVMAIAQEQSEAVQKASTIIGIGIGLLSVGRVTSSLAVKIKANTLTGTYAVDAVIDFISGLATFVGGGMVLMSILKFVYSIRTEDSQDRSKSLLLMVSGLGLISFRIIMKMVKG